MTGNKVFPFSIIEFTPYSWLMLCLFYMVLLILFGLVLCFLKSFGLERIESQQSHFQFALENSVNVCLRALINKASTTMLQSHTYKMMLTTLMTFSLVVMSYYRAQMNAALNSQVDNIGINSWQEVLESHHKFIFWDGAYPEDIFKYAPKRSVLNKIYQKKMANAPVENYLQNIKFEGAISALLSNDNYLILNNEEPFLKYKEYPCQISKISALQ